jgi:D-sedoheptulose 7-phosphate isomerase
MSDHTDFLYPFIEGDERGAGDLLADLAASAVSKRVVSADLRSTTLLATRTQLQAVAAQMAARFALGGRLFTFGNGGSSTDAASIATLFSCPPSGRSMPARCLADDTAVLTALANDVGFDLVFARQLIAVGGPDDIALGISTSGDSRNLLRGFAEAARRGMLTVAIVGYGGGAVGASADVAACIVVPADSVHRVQEVQSALGYALWQAVQEVPAVTP